MIRRRGRKRRRKKQRKSEEEEEEEDTRTELERYCDIAQVSAKEDLLGWWSKSAFPTVAKMAKQVLACHACSSGIGRLFSKAGQNHTKSQQTTKAESRLIYYGKQTHYNDLKCCICLSANLIR